MSDISAAMYRAGSGEQVVLLHGFTAAWRIWHPILADLVARYEVIAPTLPGHHGGPPYPTDLPITFEHSTDAVEGLLDEMGIGRAHFVGNSMGGGIALELAKRGRARSVVALAPAGGWSPGDGEGPRIGTFFARQIKMLRRTHAWSERIMKRAGTRRLAFREIMRHGELVSPADAAEISQAALGCSISQQAIRELLADNAGLTIGDLDRITCPVLLATPQFDRVLPGPRHARRYLREIPDVRAITLADCGHVPVWDDAKLVTRLIVEQVEGNLWARP
ncbi:MAG TPA: alpha/beta fold hydrolase [Solirubrobacteraceae bacterium]|jgi:pimeloyl-ACP methyl ester carboxylesterase|nr:alpha/beta fold hydrolase [Solirubrobacteraceae bacterium]